MTQQTSSAATTSAQQPPVLPGQTIGMLGGGQLGRMFAIVARRMGYRIIVLTDHEDDPAAQVSDEVICGPYSPENLDQLAERCSVVTLEFENIPVEAVRRLAAAVPTHPSARVLATAQDRSVEKTTLADFGLPVTPFRTIADLSSPPGHQEWESAVEDFGYPLIVKVARSGYDGKGQQRINTSAEAESRLASFGSERVVVEQCIAFDREISAIVARNAEGQSAVFPLFENRHARHILDVTTCPAAVSAETANEARRIALTVAEKLDLVGVLCVEMFVQPNGAVLINEIAPRPHNSGHLTIEAHRVSQFEQQLRAVCGLPLGETSLRSPAAMANLLGDCWEDGPPAFAKALTVPGVTLHLYGKADARPRRKMGHLTATAATLAEAEANVRLARQRLRPEMKKT